MLYDWFCNNQDADVKQFKVSNPPISQKSKNSLEREFIQKELSPGLKNYRDQQVYVAENLYKPKHR